MAPPPIWVGLLSLDVLELDAKKSAVSLRYSADSAAGAFTGDIKLAIEEPAEMARRLMEHLAKETRRQIGKNGPGAVHDNLDDIGGTLRQFLGSFGHVLSSTDLEPMEMALALTAGVDFFSKTASLWGKELPERVAILLRRAATNLEFGHPEEARRALAKIALLDPANVQAKALAAKASKRSRGPL